MTDRERFLATMKYQPRDRSPICDFGFWAETVPTWHEQGLPKDVHYNNYDARHTDVFFGMDTYSGGPSGNVGLSPGFEWKTLEDRGDHELVQQGDGVIVLRKKFMGSIPEHHAHLLVDRASWEKHYKPRLDPDTPGRLPADLTDWKRQWSDPNRTVPCVAWGGSFYGWIRDWMGVENVSMLVYDDPGLFEEMTDTIGNLVCTVLKRCIDAGARYDGASFWEDMCYSGGPLLSPTHFKQYVIPQYKKVVEVLRANGCEVLWVDCDGKIDELLPIWLDAGINCMFPIEVGTWGADPVKYRKHYGKNLLMMGGFSKHTLARGKKPIEDEVMRLTPLVEEGGYIGFADHRVPPDVPYENYLHYLKTVRRVWGKGTNLKPCPALSG